MTTKFTVFLDRDGVFNEHHERPMAKPAALRIFDGVPEAFARLDRDDVQTCLVTNQPWVGLGLATAKNVVRTNEHLRSLLAQAGGRLDRIEAAYAPPGLGHRRRKPKPGMLEDASVWFARQGSPVDKRRAVMIGDKVRDAEAAAAFGIPAILVATTTDEAALHEKLVHAGVDAAIVADLPAAVAAVLARLDKA